MKNIIIILLLTIGFSSQAQRLAGKEIVVRDSIWINGQWVKKVTTDTSLISSAGNNEVVGTKAMKDFVQAKSISGGATDTTPLHNQIIDLQNNKLNKTDTIGKWPYLIYKRNDSFFYEKGGTEYFIGKDLVGAPQSYVDSVRNSLTLDRIILNGGTLHGDRGIYGENNWHLLITAFDQIQLSNNRLAAYKTYNGTAFSIDIDTSQGGFTSIGATVVGVSEQSVKTKKDSTVITSTTNDIRLRGIARNSSSVLKFVKQDTITKRLYYYDDPSGGGAWGSIAGTLSDQSDLNTALNALKRRDKQFKPTIKAWSSNNYRNDAADIIQKGTSDTLFTVWSRFKNGVADNDSATLYGAFSYDAGKTWEIEFQILAYTANQQIIPSVYVDGSGVYNILYNEYASSATIVKRLTSTNLTTWTSQGAVWTPGGYLSGAAGRVYRLSNGKWVYPTGLFVSGDLSSTGSVYHGKMLISSNGTTWTDTGVTFYSPDSLCGETGVFEKQGTLFYYWRSKSGVVFYESTTDLTNFTGWTSAQPIGINAPNSTTTIIYDSEMDVFIAAHNVIYQPYATTVVDISDRNIMGISVSRNQVNRWELIMNLDYDSTYHFFEPTLKIVNDHLIAAYSNEFSDAGIFKSSLVSKRIPLASILPKNTQNQFKQLQVLSYPDWWNTGSSIQLKPFTLGLRKYGLDSAYYGIWNNRAVGGVAFVPEINIKSKGTSRGFDTYIDLPTLDAGTEAFQRVYYSRNGVAPGSSYILREDSTKGSGTPQSVYQLWGDGKQYWGGIYNDHTGVAKMPAINNGIISLQAIPTGSGTALANFYLKDSALSGDRTVDANSHFLKFNNLPYMQLSRSGAFNLFMGNTSGGTDDKYWRVGVDAARNFVFGTMTDGLSGLSDYMIFNRATPAIIMAKTLKIGETTFAPISNPYIEYYNSGTGLSGRYWSQNGSAYDGQANGNDAGIVGSVAGDFVFRINGHRHLFSVDGGSTIDGELSSTGWRLPASRYFNFGATSGSTGYGIRDNAGTIEIKNSGGSWAAPGGGMTNPMTTTGDIIYSSDNSGTPARLAAGTNGYILSTVGGVPSWTNGAAWSGSNTTGAYVSGGGSISSTITAYTGTGTATFTLPALVANKNYLIKNAGDADITVQRAGADVIYTSSSVTSVTLTPGQSAWFNGGSTSWYVFFQSSNSLPDPGSNGIVVRTAANTTVARSIVTGVGIGINSGDGVSANIQPYIKGWEEWNVVTFQTTDNTQQTAVTYSCPNDGTGTLVVEMVATKTDNSKSISGRKTIHWHSTAGTVTVDEIVDDNADYLRGFTTADWTVDASSGTLRVRVTGETSNTIDWSPTYKIKYNSYAL